jgi:hypothetical protein
MGQTYESSHWPNTRAMSQIVIHHKVMSALSLWKLMFLEFLTWLTTYFPCTCTLQWKVIVPTTRDKAWGCWVHNTLGTVKFGHSRVLVNRAHRSLFWLANYNERRRWWHLNILSLYAQSITNWKRRIKSGFLCKYYRNHTFLIYIYIRGENRKPRKNRESERERDMIKKNCRILFS